VVNSTSELNLTRSSIATQYRQVRQLTDLIVEPLSAEDCMVQSMEDVSPTRWHLAHTTWFFETFILQKQPGYEAYGPQFNFLFNSYYNTVGKQFPRPQRGFVSRPGLAEIKRYREYVDDQVMKLLASDAISDEVAETICIGINHEQQHQELMLTDLKHVLSCNPMLPAYRDFPLELSRRAANGWCDFEEGIYEVGAAGSEFCFDNESPRHRVFLHDFSIARDLVTCGQYIDYIEDGGYQRPDHWLSLGWGAVNGEDWDAPLYWFKQDGQWMQFTLAGVVPVDPQWPVCHLSYFEADAFARWSGHRLPTEFEWEVACEGSLDETLDLKTQPFADGLFDRKKAIHPTCSPDSMLGSVWQWTSSSYAAYPGYRPPDGALGEYNGKFMCNQYVLRGGSVATSSNHIRPTYRNFFPAHARWQFSGLRLVR
jgi:ergothioneine biosynthesis protein EgtB